MTLAPPTPTAGLPPLQLPWDLRLNADQFERVCQANPDAVLELSADGQLIAMTPTGSETGARNQALGALLWLAVCRSGLPLQAFDSSSGFRLPDGSVLCPDASLSRGNTDAVVAEVCGCLVVDRGGGAWRCVAAPCQLRRGSCCPWPSWLPCCCCSAA